MKGLKEFRDAFRRLKDDSPKRLGDAAKRHLEENVFPKTEEKVPVATGALKGTGRIEEGDKPNSWRIKYGDSPEEDDSAVDYAAAVHEILEHRHAEPTQVKFVEEPLKESVEDFRKLAAEELDKLARGE